MIRQQGKAVCGPRRRRSGIDSDYLALVRRFPLRPIRGPRDYDAAAEVLDGLVTKDENELTPGERDYLDTLTLLVERYDDEHYRMDLARKAPAETLKYLMEQSAMGVADLDPTRLYLCLDSVGGVDRLGVGFHCSEGQLEAAERLVDRRCS